jgi:hypothetical protein
MAPTLGKALLYLPALRGIGQIQVTLTSVAPNEDSRPVVSSYLCDLAAKIRASSGLPVDWVVHSGIPYAQIIAQSAHLGVDLLLMATHGRGSKEAWRLGSESSEEAVESILKSLYPGEGWQSMACRQRSC